jgi:RNA polymerase primary sigma factor
MTNGKQPTAKELKAQADAILAAADAAEKAKQAAEETTETAPPAVQEETVEEGKSPSRASKNLDDKMIASLPASALIMSNEKLRDLLAKGKKKWRRPTSVWWCPSPSATWAAACCSWT